MLAAVFWLDLGPRAHTMCLVDIFSSAPADENFGLEAQYFQRFCQDCHKCKCESWRLIIVLWFDMIIFLTRSICVRGWPRAKSRWFEHLQLWTPVWTFRPLLCDDLLIKRLKCVRKYWRTRLGLSFKMSIIVNRFKLTSRCLARCPLLLVQLRTAAA